MSGTSAAEAQTALAVVGAIVPDDPRFYGPAFNRAAQMFNDELIRGLSQGGLGPTTVFSVEPLPSFPRSRRLFGRTGAEVTRGGKLIRLLPFVNVQPLKVLTTGLSTLAALILWAWRHRTRQRVIHVINLTMPPGSFVWVAARLTRSRVTVSVLDVWKPGVLVPDTWSWRLDFAMQRWLLPRFDGHMVVSQAIADDFVPNRPVCILEGGIAPDRLIPRRERQRSLPENRFRVVLAGSLEPFNGVALAAEALKLLPAGYELVIAGSGSLTTYVRQVATHEPRIIDRGFLSFDEVVDLYFSADLLLNLRLTVDFSTRYFFPSKLMELLASGTPVLSTSTGHTASEYGHVLYLLDEETPQALARRIIEISSISDADRQAVGARARAFMLQNKTWERQCERLVRYIRDEVLI